MKLFGYINIYRTDNVLLCGPVYEEENKAVETGKKVKGYICTTSISFDIPDEEIK